MKILNIDTSNSYNVYIGSQLYKNLSHYMEQNGIEASSKILIVTDTNIEKLYLMDIKNNLKGYNVYSYVVPATESSKSMNYVEKIIQFSLEIGLDRSSVIIALGGGVIGDLAGFVSAIYMRGIRYIQMPTTILAHDSSVGGKVGVNHKYGKNLIGSFHHPQMVIYDTSFLHTLPQRDIRSGIAEVIKHSLITDRDFAYWLYDNVKELMQINEEKISYALYKGINIKADVVRQDEKETGIRAILNYGHTLAHPLETISNYEYRHGEAVAIGMVYAVKLAYYLGKTTKETEQFTVDLISSFGLPIFVSKEYSNDALLEIMMKDKKFINNTVRMILPNEIGDVSIIGDIEQDSLIKILDEIKQ